MFLGDVRAGEGLWAAFAATWAMVRFSKGGRGLMVEDSPGMVWDDGRMVNGCCGMVEGS